MPNRPSNPFIEYQLVRVNDHSYVWDSEGGLDPEAVDELKGLIRSIAYKRFSGLHHAAGVTLDDLLQEGRMGAMRAAERWNPNGGATFATYANTWIRGAMSRAVQKSLVHTPEGREKAVLVFADHTLDDPTDELTLWDVVYGELDDQFKPVGADQLLESRERLELLGKAMKGLSRLQRKVVEHRYGLNQEDPEQEDGLSFAKVADALGISASQARVVHAEALTALARELRGISDPNPEPPAPARRRRTRQQEPPEANCLAKVA